MDIITNASKGTLLTIFASISIPLLALALILVYLKIKAKEHQEELAGKPFPWLGVAGKLLVKPKNPYQPPEKDDSQTEESS